MRTFLHVRQPFYVLSVRGPQPAQSKPTTPDFGESSVKGVDPVSRDDDESRPVHPSPEPVPGVRERKCVDDERKFLNTRNQRQQDPSPPLKVCKTLNRARGRVSGRHYFETGFTSHATARTQDRGVNTTCSRVKEVPDLSSGVQKISTTRRRPTVRLCRFSGGTRCSLPEE